MRQKIAISTSLAATALALLTAIADMSGNSRVICSSTACEKVHSSTFATLFNLPVGFYAAAILAVTLFLYIRKKKKIASALLYRVGAPDAKELAKKVFAEKERIDRLRHMAARSLTRDQMRYIQEWQATTVADKKKKKRQKENERSRRLKWKK